MGNKGDKDSSKGQEAAEKLIDDLAVIPGVTTKKMFGGYGVFHEGQMFAMVDSKGQSFLKFKGESQKKFEALGCEKHSKMPYFTIPDKVRGNREELVAWANTAITESKKS